MVLPFCFIRVLYTPSILYFCDAKNHAFRMKNFSVITLLFFVLFSCSTKQDTLFEELPAEQTGIDFVNRSLEKKEFNIFNYRNFYMEVVWLLEM